MCFPYNYTRFPNVLVSDTLKCVCAHPSCNFPHLASLIWDHFPPAPTQSSLTTPKVWLVPVPEAKFGNRYLLDSFIRVTAIQDHFIRNHTCKFRMSLVTLVPATYFLLHLQEIGHNHTGQCWTVLMGFLAISSYLHRFSIILGHCQKIFTCIGQFHIITVLLCFIFWVK